MTRPFIMWALLWLTAPFMCLNAEVTDSLTYSLPDTLSDIHSLGEVTVKARSKIEKLDRKVIFLSGERLASSTDGLNLLSRLQLPQITVNALTGSVTHVGGGEVWLCINGVRATEQEITAITPADIIKVEYHDNPGVRYDGAAAVIDFITRVNTSGGSLFFDTFGGAGKGKWASLDNLAASASKGPSTWTLNAGYMGLGRDNWTRDYTETWHYADHTVTHREEGLPVSFTNLALQSSLSYTYTRPEHTLFNARFGFDWTNNPAQEEGDRHTLLYTDDNDTPIEIVEHTAQRSITPSLALYYRRDFSRSNAMVINATAALLRSAGRHYYIESPIDDATPSSAIYSGVTGSKPEIKLEGYYERGLPLGRLMAGARHSQSYTRNIYRGDISDTTCINEYHTALFAEYSASIGNWSLRGNLAAGAIHLNQRHVSSLTQYYLNPSAGVSYRPCDDVNLRYNIALTTQAPPLAALSDVEQTIQTGMIRRGNPALKSSDMLSQTFAAAYSHPLFDINLMVDYSHEYHPVMTEVLAEGDRFVETYDNQRSFGKLTTTLSFILRPWGDHLSLGASPTLTRFISRGNSYTHTATIIRPGLSLDFTYGHWSLNACTMSGAANTMYGEELMTEKDMNMIMAGYHGKCRAGAWSIEAGVFNAFMHEYTMTTRNYAALTPYTSVGRCRNNGYAMVKFTLSLSHGRHTPAPDEIPGLDISGESGIMDGLK